MNTQRGYSLIEVMIGTVLILTGALAVMSLSTAFRGSITKFKFQNQGQNLLYNLVTGVVAEAATDPGVLAGPEFNAADFDPLDDDKSTRLCYDRTGQPTKPEGECFYQVRYLVVQLVDTSLPVGSDLAPLPLKRIYLKIDYRDSTSPHTLRLSQLVTPVLAQ